MTAQVLCVYDRDAFLRMESGYDDVDDSEITDEFGQMTRDRRMKRELEFFFSQIEEIELVSLIDDRALIPATENLTHPIPQACAVYVLHTYNDRMLIVPIHFT